MTFVATDLPSRVKFTTTITGTVAFSEGSAVTDFRNLSAVTGSNGRRFPYLCRNADFSEWEIGVGTYTSGTPGSLARTKVLRSSNSNNIVSFSAGTKTVSIVDLGVYHGAHDGEMHTAEIVTSGAALTCNVVPAPYEVRDGLRIAGILDADIPADATLNPNGLGAAAIKEQRPSGLANVSAARFKAGMAVVFRYWNGAWQITNGMVADAVPNASDTVAGLAERATTAEVLAGTDTSRFVTPADLSAAVYKKGANLADGSTVTIPATGGAYFVLDGTTSLSAVALEGGNSTRPAGYEVTFLFAAAKTVVHSASLNLVDDVNLAAAPGDILVLRYEGSGVWREADFHLAETPAPPDPTGTIDIETDNATSNLSLTTSFQDTGLEVTVNVPSASAKVVLIATVPWEGNIDEMRFQFRRDSTDIGPDIGETLRDNGGTTYRGVTTLMRYDVPGAAGAYVYKLRAKRLGNGGSAQIVGQTGPSNDEAQIVALVVEPV